MRIYCIRNDLRYGTLFSNFLCMKCHIRFMGAEQELHVQPGHREHLEDRGVHPGPQLPLQHLEHVDVEGG